MSMAGESVTRARPPWWMFVLGAAFVAYFSLLLHADLTRAEPHGLEVQFDQTGVILPTVAPGSPADAAGLRDGDRVLTVDGREVGSRVEWQVIEANVSNGVPVVFEISRDGSAYRRSLTLSRVSPAYWGSAAGADPAGAPRGAGGDARPRAVGGFSPTRRCVRPRRGLGVGRDRGVFDHIAVRMGGELA